MVTSAGAYGQTCLERCYRTEPSRADMPLLEMHADAGAGGLKTQEPRLDPSVTL